MSPTDAATAAPARCSRCGGGIEEQFRFCPQCGLPAGTGLILSNQISAARQIAESESAAPGHTNWQRLVFVAAITCMVFFVVTLGVLLFNRSYMEEFFDPAPVFTRPVSARPDWEPEWVSIPQGQFTPGPPRSPPPPPPPPANPTPDEPGPTEPPEAPEAEYQPEPVVVDAFHMSKHEVPNSLWHEFLLEEQESLLRAGTWNQCVPRTGPDGDGWTIGADGRPMPRPEEMSLPVRNVTPIAVAQFCIWATARLAESGWQIRVPTREEWEYAARGETGRIYPWGDRYWVDPAAGTGAPRRSWAQNIGQARPSPVHLIGYDKSPFGVLGMGSNVEEMAWDAQPKGYRIAEQPGLPIQAYRCGASFATSEVDGEELARAWRTDRDLPPSIGFPELGVRLVKARVPLRTSEKSATPPR